MKFVITIETGNAAFGECAADKVQEITAILETLAERMTEEPERTEFNLGDYNGNGVGNAEYVK